MDRMVSTPVSLDRLFYIVWRRWPFILGLSIIDLQESEFKDSGVIEVTIDGPSPQLAKKIATTINNFLNSIHLKKYDSLVDSLRFRY